MTLQLLYFCGRLALAGVLAIAAVSKFRDLSGFRSGLAQYEVVPTRALRSVAVAVPALELVAALALVTDYPPLLGPGLAAIILGAFSAAMLANVSRGRAVPCHCFGASDTEVVDWTSTLRTIALTGLAVLLFGLGMRGYPWPSGDDIVPGITIAAAVVLVTRLVGFAPTAWSYLREARSLCAGSARRVSLRGEPLDTSIKALFGAPAPNNNGHVVDASAVLHQIGDRA